MEQQKLDNAKEVDQIKSIPVIDTILDVICQTTGMGFAAIARVTKNQWIACAVKDNIHFGLLPGNELVLETTICKEIENHHEVVTIDHVAADAKYSKHHTPIHYGFQSYISVPIILKDGSFYGTLCAIDPKPASLNTPKILGMFTLFADLLSLHLSAITKLSIAESELLKEKETSELRDQFIAILGHDLRNPVGAIRNSAQLLMRMQLNERATRLATIIQDSSFRITGLIENVLDFARGHLGEGIILNRNPAADLQKELEQVVGELQTIWPSRAIYTTFDLKSIVNCDSRRIAQLFSNLLGNALTHGQKDLPVKVVAISKDETFSLCVSNAGVKIPVETIERLFLPFSRGTGERDKEGLGLGLYISSQIAKAHGGTLAVTSTDEETCFSCII